MSKQTKELKTLSRQALTAKLDELRRELVEQKRARAAGELMNNQAIKKTRRTIAVTLTLLGQQASEPEKKEETK